MVVKEKKPRTKKVKAMFSREKIIAEDTSEARSLYDQSRFGELQEGKFYYSLVEGLYLIEKKKIEVEDGKKKKLKIDDFIKKARKIEPNFWIRYVVFRDMIDRCYIIKTALKFGADFRVYDRGVKPGQDHAKWILYPIHEATTLTWYEFSAKNRVAHSTRKNLLIGIVDDENDVTYYSVSWTRP
ncbi:MAG: tRNA-intron lyase [Candidatus Nanoarchaeia archaeon]|nr:tRNA-intron lyase [Candidatus Nanoarchaeia archaeon]